MQRFFFFRFLALSHSLIVEWLFTKSIATFIIIRSIIISCTLAVTFVISFWKTGNPLSQISSLLNVPCFLSANVIIQSLRVYLQFCIPYPGYTEKIDCLICDVASNFIRCNHVSRITVDPNICSDSDAYMHMLTHQHFR